MARTRDGADIGKAFDAIGVQHGDKALDGQGRMPDGENRAFRPLCRLWGRVIAHEPGHRVNTIMRYGSSNTLNAVSPANSETRSRTVMYARGTDPGYGPRH